MLSLNSYSLTKDDRTILDSVTLTLAKGSVYLVYGESGSGKSSLLQALMQHADTSTRVSYLGTESQRRLQQAYSQYYQERWVSLQDSSAVRVRDFLLQKKFRLHTMHFREDREWLETDPELLEYAAGITKMHRLLDSKIISLSNGELRRLILCRCLMEAPDVLLLDDLWGGLDPEYSIELLEALFRLSSTPEAPAIILTGSHFPEAMQKLQTELFSLDSGRLISGIPEVAFLCSGDFNDFPVFQNEVPIGDTPIVELKDIRVRYGEKQVLEQVNWAIYPGEHWLVSGHNGSGKSTLISLLNGDHPQMYCNQVQIFGMIPGQGMDVWELRRRIGFYSPEQQHHIPGMLSVEKIIASSLMKNEFFRKELNSEQRKKVQRVLEKADAEDLSGKKWSALSEGERRLVLFLSVLIKEPEILILDEVSQGLDSEHTKRILELVDQAACDHQIVFVSHQPEALPDCLNRRLHLEAGRRVI